MKNVYSLKKAIVISAIVLFSLIFVSVTVAYLSTSTEEETDLTIGTVSVKLKAYFKKDSEIYEASNYIYTFEDATTLEKRGVIKINISDREAKEFAENFRVDIEIYSDVDTYFRIATYEQLTLVYKTGDVTRELAVVQDGYTDFNYNFGDNFYDNRDKDGFIYCKNKVKRIDKDTPLSMTLIGEYYSDKVFGIRDERYFLQIGFIIEAVQAYEGAQNNWGLDRTPWDSEW